MKVIYHHNCIDGFTAAWVATRIYARAELFPAQYGEAPPDVTGQEVLILDFSYPRETLLAMYETAESLLVLDHHKTAQADLDGLDFCVFDMDRSGAGLAWDILIPESSRPKLVNYVEDRDLWRWELPESKPVNALIGSYEQSLEQWTDLAVALDRDFATCIGQGQALIRGVDRYVREMAKQARMTELGGWGRIPVVNAPYINTSELVGHLAEHSPDGGEVAFAVGWFQRGDGKFQYSLRSRGDFDVSLIAKMFGGGGHKNAAGFTVDKLVHE